MENLQHLVLPPETSGEAEQSAQRILDALPWENLLSDFIALRVAISAYVANSPFPAEGARKFFRTIHGVVTLSGVQKKIALELDGTTFRIAVGGSRFLLKPQIAEYPQFPENEHLTLKLAALFGIPAAAAGLVRLRDDSLALLVRRFDRADDGGKIAMEDFCQLAALLPGDKYQGSAELCARILRQFSSAPPLDLLALYRQLLFSWWTGNGDVHLKNLALLDRDRGAHRLSPGYDLVNTAVVNRTCVTR